jgi:predicted glycoside hydrolase/deacetylase ChbG (UPF0249 family)
MIIVNADDWGRSRAETDVALQCHQASRITSVSAMVFMEDSERAAAAARHHGIEAGLHLNLSEDYSCPPRSAALAAAHARLVRFMVASKYTVLIYDPRLRTALRDIYRSQLEEAVRLYGDAPSHVDGHHHKHLALNVILDGVIPRGMKVRRHFSFSSSDKGRINRLYRSLMTAYMRRRYRMTNYFFSLAMCHQPCVLDRVVTLARTESVEVMTHPVKPAEYALLMSNRYRDLLATVCRGSYADL